MKKTDNKDNTLLNLLNQNKLQENDALLIITLDNGKIHIDEVIITAVLTIDINKIKYITVRLEYLTGDRADKTYYITGDELENIYVIEHIGNTDDIIKQDNNEQELLLPNTKKIIYS